mgnify:CR=1 FL=1
MTRPMIEWTYHYNDATGTVMATTRMGAQEAAGKALGISHRKNYLIQVTRIKPVEPIIHFQLPLTREQVSALYIHLFHRKRPAWGWMEEPLIAIETALLPVHSEIHSEDFDAMDAAFHGRSK